MKKYLTLLFSLILLVLGLSSCKSSVPAKFTYEKANGGYVISGVRTNGNKEIVFPATYNGSAVVGIASGVGASLGELESVVVSEGIEEIGDNFLTGDFAIDKLILPSTLSKIGAGFLGNSWVKEIEMSGIGGKYTVQAGVLYTKDLSTLVRYPSGREDASFSVPTGVSTIGDYAFKGSWYLDSVILTDGVRKIGSYAFSNSRIKTLNTENIQSFGEGAFSGCSFEELTLDTNITEKIMSDCYVKYLNLGKNVKNIEKYAYPSLSTVAEVRVSEENENYSSLDGHLTSKDKKSLLLYCSGKNQNIYQIPYGIEVIEEYSCSDRARVTSIVVTDNVKVIKAYAFMNCANLREVHIGINVSKIEAYAFYGCVSLYSVPFKCTTYWHIGDVKYNADNKTENANRLREQKKDFVQYIDEE